jgi:hypothetical protein
MVRSGSRDELSVDPTWMLKWVSRDKKADFDSRSLSASQNQVSRWRTAIRALR